MRIAKTILRTLSFVFSIVGLFVPHARATVELKPATVTAFEHYIHATEDRMDEDVRKGRFLVLDGLPSGRKEDIYAKVRQGAIYIQPMHTTEDGRAIPIPGGLVHHWAGVMFIPGANAPRVLAVLQDYDNHQNIFKPDIRRSRLLGHTGDRFSIYVQFYKKSIVTVVINANFDAQYTQLDSTHVASRSYSTRIAELQYPDTPGEHEFPVGNDHGYLWRLDNYWHLEEKDGGVYVQIEWVALSRTVPAVFGWLVNPLIRSIPRGVITNLLAATRNEATKVAPPPASPPTD